MIARSVPSGGSPAWLAAGVAIVAGIPIGAVALLGSFSRYLADDFCTAGTLERMGFWPSQAYWYESWSGRFSFTFAMSAAHSLGPGLTPWLPALVLGLWLVAAAFAFRTWFGASSLPRWAEWSLATLLLFVTLDGSPSLYQSLLWQTGLVTYGIPLALGTLLAAVVLRRDESPRAGALLMCGALAFFAAGFSETYVALQTTAILLALGVVWADARPRARDGKLVLLGVALLGSLAAFAVIALAPGNAVRQSAFATPSSLPAVLGRSLHDEYIFLARVVKGHPWSLALASVLPLFFGLRSAAGAPSPARRQEKPRRWVLFLFPFLIALLVLVPFVPYEYAISSYPDGRVLITAQYALALGVVSWSFWAGRELGGVRPRLAGAVSQRPGLAVSAVLILALAAVMWVSLGPLRELAPLAREYARSWDERDANLRPLAGQDGLVEAASLRHMGGLAEIGRDPNEWVNRCVAWTYRLDQVVAK